MIKYVIIKFEDIATIVTNSAYTVELFSAIGQ